MSLQISIGMGAILKNIEFKGCTMGSTAEFKAAMNFIGEHKIRPVVHTVLKGLEGAEEGFELMKVGGQFGKVSRISIIFRFEWILAEQVLSSHCMDRRL